MFANNNFPFLSTINRYYNKPLRDAMLIAILVFILKSCSKERDPLMKAASKSKGVIIGRNNCGYCDKAIGLMKSANIEFTYIPTESKPKLQGMVVDRYKHKTVPAIFMDNEFVGGYSDLVELLDE